MLFRSNKPVQVDFRLISATNRDMIKMVHDGLFREDLYYRISEFPVIIPPLRERLGDIEDLINYFIMKFCSEMKLKQPKVDPEVYIKLKKYNWPGNIRELENVIKRVMIIIGDETVIKPGNFNFLSNKVLNNGNVLGKDNWVEFVSNEIINRNIQFNDIENIIIKSILGHFDGDVMAAVKETNIKKDRFYKIRNENIK